MASPNQLPKTPRGYRNRNGTLAGASTSFHKDPRGQRLLEQIRECESTQAVGRLRLVHSAHKKRVVILSSVPLDIDVDELVTLDELAQTPGRIGPVGNLRAAMREKGILPLGPGDLVKAFPKRFRSISVARDALRDARDMAASIRPRPATKLDPDTADGGRGDRDTGGTATPPHGPYDGPGEQHAPDHINTMPRPGGLNGGELPLIYIGGFPPHLIGVTYRRAGQRGKPSRALIDADRHPEPREALEGLLGEEVVMLGSSMPPKLE